MSVAIRPPAFARTGHAASVGPGARGEIERAREERERERDKGGDREEGAVFVVIGLIFLIYCANSTVAYVL